MEPIKLMLWLTPVIAALLYINGLRAEAVAGKERSEQANLVFLEILSTVRGSLSDLKDPNVIKRAFDTAEEHFKHLPPDPKDQNALEVRAKFAVIDGDVRRTLNDLKSAEKLYQDALAIRLVILGRSPESPVALEGATEPCERYARLLERDDFPEVKGWNRIEKWIQSNLQALDLRKRLIDAGLSSASPKERMWEWKQACATVYERLGDAYLASANENKALQSEHLAKAQEAFGACENLRDEIRHELERAHEGGLLLNRSIWLHALACKRQATLAFAVGDRKLALEQIHSARTELESVTQTPTPENRIYRRDLAACIEEEANVGGNRENLFKAGDILRSLRGEEPENGEFQKLLENWQIRRGPL